VATLIRFKREGFKPDRHLILALTADEEVGWGEVSNGKRVSNDIQVNEKYVATYRFEAKNRGGHSMGGMSGWA
jgi:hypothetical protein